MKVMMPKILLVIIPLYTVSCDIGTEGLKGISNSTSANPEDQNPNNRPDKPKDDKKKLLENIAPINKRRDNSKDYPTLERYANGKEIQESFKSWNYKEALSLIKSSNIDVNASVHVSGSMQPLIMGINPTIKKKDGEALFDYIISQPNFDPNRTNDNGENVLFESFLTNDQLKKLITLGANINQVNNFGETPLTEQDYSIENIRTIIEHPTYIHNQRAIDKTLRSAESSEMAQYLFSKGAKITFNKDNQSPLFNFYAQKNPLELFEVTLKEAQKQGISKTALINSQIKIKSGLNPIYDGNTILHYCILGLTDLVKKPQLDRDIETVVGIFFPEPPQENREYKIRTLIRFLIENGADINIKNAAGQSPADLAKKIGLSLTK